MKLTRRGFLKGGAITALALAVGVKAKATGGRVMKWPPLVPYRNVSPELVQDTEDQEAWRRDLPTGPLRLGDLEAILWSLEPPYTETQRAWIKGRFPLTRFDEEGYAR